MQTKELLTWIYRFIDNIIPTAFGTVLSSFSLCSEFSGRVDRQTDRRISRGWHTHASLASHRWHSGCIQYWVPPLTALSLQLLCAPIVPRVQAPTLKRIYSPYERKARAGCHWKLLFSGSVCVSGEGRWWVLPLSTILCSDWRSGWASSVILLLQIWQRDLHKIRTINLDKGFALYRRGLYNYKYTLSNLFVLDVFNVGHPAEA